VHPRRSVLAVRRATKPVHGPFTPFSQVGYTVVTDSPRAAASVALDPASK